MENNLTKEDIYQQQNIVIKKGPQLEGASSIDATVNNVMFVPSVLKKRKT